jgi:lipid-binding SYLF domain-containing protein
MRAGLRFEKKKTPTQKRRGRDMHRNWMHSGRRNAYCRIATAALTLAVFGLLSACATYQGGPDIAQSREMVERANMTFSHFIHDPNMGWIRANLPKAKAVLIVPSQFTASFIVGASGGSGVLLAHDMQNGQWSYPAFYTLGGASIGLQGGAKDSEILLVIMTDKGLNAFLTSSFKLGADASVAAGPVGVGAAAKFADIYAFSRAQGVYAGISVDGSVVSIRDDWNQGYYGRPLTPVDILIRHAVQNPHADPLREAIAKASGK